MRRWSALFILLIGCSGSGATVSDSSSSDIHEAPSVEPFTPTSPTSVDPTTTIECKTNDALSDGSVHTIRFALKGDVLEEDIVIDPPSAALAPLAKATLEKKGGKLVLLSNDRAELALFENSDLTRGYVRAAGEYSNVFCTKR